MTKTRSSSGDVAVGPNKLGGLGNGKTTDAEIKSLSLSLVYFCILNNISLALAPHTYSFRIVGIFTRSLATMWFR